MFKNQEFTEVHPSEVALVEKARAIQTAAWEKSEKEAREASLNAGQYLKSPMAFIENPEEKRIVDECDKLAEKYRLEKNLKIPPILIPPTPTWQYAPPVDQGFHQYRKKDLSQLSQLELTNLFLERVPVRRHGNVLYVWNGTHYAALGDKDFKGLIEEVLQNELIHIGNTNATISAILALLQSKQRIQSASDCDSNMIALRNGILNLDLLRPEPANPHRFITYFLDADWRANAPCPVFQNFLWSVSGGDQELFQRLLEAIGFLLTPGNQAKKFVVFQGVPNSGKSVLGNLVQSFFRAGDFSSLPLHQFGDRFAMGSLASQHLNVSMDLTNGAIDGKSAAIIKQITGGDQVFVEAKGKDGYATTIPCKLLFGTNHCIQLKTADAAFANRVLLVPFLISVPTDQMDTHLIEKLCMEKSGILYAALAAYREVVRRNYHFTGEDRFGFKHQETQPVAQPTDYVRAFIQQCCQAAPDSFLTTEQLHQAFETFCAQNGFPAIADRSAFSRAFRSCLGDQIKATKRRVAGTPLNGYVGVNFQNGAN